MCPLPPSGDAVLDSCNLHAQGSGTVTDTGTDQVFTASGMWPVPQSIGQLIRDCSRELEVVGALLACSMGSACRNLCHTASHRGGRKSSGCALCVWWTGAPAGPVPDAPIHVVGSRACACRCTASSATHQHHALGLHALAAPSARRPLVTERPQ